VAHLIAVRWSATIEEVIASSTISSYRDPEFAVIGTIGGKPIERSAHTLRNPHITRKVPRRPTRIE
jgi:hypothetical protein